MFTIVTREVSSFSFLCGVYIRNDQSWSINMTVIVFLLLFFFKSSTEAPFPMNAKENTAPQAAPPEPPPVHY